MPTYEYRCKECGEHLEVVQSFKDDALTECPACHGPLRKVFGNIGITFKGSGFYKTDSRAASGATRKSGSGEATSSESASKSESKSGEAKSADSKSGESKSGESKSGESKSGEAKAGDSSAKAAATG